MLLALLTQFSSVGPVSGKFTGMWFPSAIKQRAETNPESPTPFPLVLSLERK